MSNNLVIAIDQEKFREGARRTGTALVPDTDQWINGFLVKSERSSRLYKISQHRKTLRWSCNCPDNCTRGHIRPCKHLLIALPILQAAAAARPGLRGAA